MYPFTKMVLDFDGENVNVSEQIYSFDCMTSHILNYRPDEILTKDLGKIY